ncbi:delta 1-pyrroline-5-carboxylate reductase, partial [Coelomomyces lativittatus]
MQTLHVKRLCILGCGTMGTAILSGLMTSGFMKAHPEFQVALCITQNSKKSVLTNKFNSSQVHVYVQRNEEACHWAQAVVLCVKPQLAGPVLLDAGITLALQGKLLISILAGVSLRQLQQWCPSSTIIRAMPNTPCQILQGMTVLACDKEHTSELDQQFAEMLFKQLGRCIYLDEKHM